MTKVMLREHVAFANATADAMRQLGADQIDPPDQNDNNALVVFAGRFRLNTKAGPLNVSAYGDAIMTRFDDAEAGRAAVGATVPSGKWNFHGFNAGLEHGEADPDNMVLSLFMQRLAPILLK